jgi:hypothetical protein
MNWIDLARNRIQFSALMNILLTFGFHKMLGNVGFRTRITAAVAEVTSEMLRSVWQETDYRRDVYRITIGSQIEP